MRFAKLAFGTLLGFFLMFSQASYAEDKPYTEGTVWTVTFIKVKPGMFDVYMRDLLAQRKKLYEEAKKAGLVISERMLSGAASGRDDWDLMLMTEYKNYAALDGLSDKFEAIQLKVIGSEAQRVQTMVKRSDMREIIGEKLMQELHHK
jgi:hypothetical protein